MEQFNNPFETSGIDPVQGSQIMQTLGMSMGDLSAPDKFNKLNDIMKYVGNKQGGDYLLSRIVNGKPGIDKLSTAWEYVGLRSKHDSIKGEMDRLTKELELYER